MHKILVSAYGCEPRKGSEQGVGWHWVQEMAKNERLWVITRSNNRQAIEAAILPELKERISFIYFDLPNWLRGFKRNEKGLYPYYFLWQCGVYRKAKLLIKDIKFDYCLHLTFGSMWMPTFMYKLPVPFVWGPIGGGESIPAKYISTLPWQGRLPQFVRKVLMHSTSINPLFFCPANAATSILVRTADSKMVFPSKYHHKIRVILETGMDSENLAEYKSASIDKQSDLIELVYVGRLIPLKNVETAIRAVHLVQRNQKNIRLTIVGDGPSKDGLIRLSRKLKLQDRVRFLGNIENRKAIKVMQRSDIFIFPSLKEGGTWSLLEALAAGLPVICLDTSGMHIITDDDCATRIPPTTPEESPKLFAAAISKLASSPGLREKMGAAGRQRIQDHFQWSNKGDFMKNLLLKLDTLDE